MVLPRGATAAATLIHTPKKGACIEADNNRDNSNIGKFGANIPIILLIIKWPSILSKRCARTFKVNTH